MPYRYDTPSNPHVMSIAESLARRGDIAAQRALSVANAQAQAQQARGQIWGNAVQNIGQTVAAIPQQMQQSRRAAMQDEAGQIELQDARAAQATVQRQTEDRGTLQSAMSSRLPPDEIKAQLQQMGRGDLVPIFEKTWTDLESSRVSLTKAKTELGNLEADYFGSMAAGIKKSNFEPMAVAWALSEAEADGHDTKQLRELLQQNPQALPKIVDALIEKSPAQRKLIGEDSDRALKLKTEERAVADMQADNARAAATAKETARHNREQERIASLTAGRAAAQAAETARHNLAMEENARNTKTGRPVISGDANRIAEFDTSLDDTKVLREAITETGTLPRLGTYAPTWVSEITGGWGDDAKSRNAVIARVKQVIGKALEGGVLRKEDEEKYKDILPTIGDPKQVAQSKLDGLAKALEQRRGRLIDSLDDAGYNVGEFRSRVRPGAGVGGSGVMVNMTAPDGRPLQVPAEQVDEAKRRGATMVGQ